MAVHSTRRLLTAFKANCMATAASNRPMIRMAILITIGLSRFAPLAETRRIT